MNITRSSMNNSIVLVARHNRMINSENMIKNWMEKQITYWALTFGKTSEDDRTKTVLLTECSSRCHGRRFVAAPDLDGGRAVMKILKQSRRALPKKLFVLSRCRISRMEVTETCSPDRRCTPTLAMMAAQQQERGKNLAFITLAQFCNVSLSWYILWWQPMG